MAGAAVGGITEIILKSMEEDTIICGNCLLCIQTYLGCECSLTDNSVEYTQEGCADYIPE